MTGSKRCGRCKELKMLARFSKNRNAGDGLQSICKRCGMEKYVEFQRKRDPHYRLGPERAPKAPIIGPTTAAMRHRLKSYGLTACGYARLRIEQGDLCKICGAANGGRPLNIDHCHESGRVRGLLCARCNTALGAFGDNVDGLLRAVEYLQG